MRRPIQLEPIALTFHTLPAARKALLSIRTLCCAGKGLKRLNRKQTAELRSPKWHQIFFGTINLHLGPSRWSDIDGRRCQRLRARFPRVGSFEDGIQVLQGSGFRLDIEEIDESEFENIPEHKEDVKPVTDLTRASVADHMK